MIGRPTLAYHPRVRRRALAWLGLMAVTSAAACTPELETPTDATPGAVAALIVRLDPETGRVIDARAVEPYPPTEPLVLSTNAAAPTTLLTYPQPLAAYGLRLTERKTLVLDEDGVPLPAPSHWLELDPQDGQRARDVAAEWPGPLGVVRVPQRPCLGVQEVPGTRLEVDFQENIAFAAPLSPQHTLMVFDSSNVFERPRIEVRTPTATVPLPFLLRPLKPRGFVEEDGSAWVVVYVATSTAPDDLGFPTMCHFRAGDPYAPPDCAPASGPQPLFEAVAGRRGADGRLEMAAISWDFALYHWQGDANDRGQWRKLFVGGIYEAPGCTVGSSTVHVELDGPGTGVASFESGHLVRFDVATGAHPLMFEAPAGETSTHCRAVYARHPLGTEVFARKAEVPDTLIEPRPQFWWRSAASSTTSWQRYAEAEELDLESLTVMGDAVLTGARTYSMAALVVDPLRPDLPPRRCPVTPVFNSARLVVPAGDGQFLTAGEFAPPGLGYAAVSRWRLVPLAR